MTKIFLSSFIQPPEKVTSDSPGKTKSINFFNKHVSAEEIEVAQTAFYDLGFDPDFSVSGNVFYKKPSLYEEQPTFNFFHSLIKVVHDFIKYFLQTPEEKAFQELVEIEKIWHKAGLEKGMLYPSDNDLKGIWQSRTMPHMCYLREYQFLKKLSEIDNAPKIYAAELLRPLHLFNRPQRPSEDSKTLILKGKCLKNRDVARLGTWGFSRLGNHEKEPIRHKEFLEAIHIPGDKLKDAIRDLRVAVRSQDYKKFNDTLKIFKNSWGDYINSHKLLEGLSSIYSQEDFFKEMYKAHEKDYQKMKDFDFSKQGEFIEIQMKATSRITNLSDAGYERLKEKMS